MHIPMGRMWAFSIGVDNAVMGASSMFRRTEPDSVVCRETTIVPNGFHGAFDLDTWSQEDKAAYMDGYESMQPDVKP